MSVEILYHDFDDHTDSVFEDRIHALAADSSLRIACPYLSLDILRTIIDRSEDWRLVTDIQEWFRTDRENRESIRPFIRNHETKIRDCRNLHAKVVLGTNAAMVGSANITEAGLTSNAEVSVLLEETNEVLELQTWFRELWERADNPAVGEFQTYADVLKRSEKHDVPEPSMPNTGPTIKSHLAVFGRTEHTDPYVDRKRLVDILRSAPDRMWAEMYFDWVEGVIEAIEADESDERLAMSVPSSSSRLPVSVNHRYVLSGFPAESKIGIILPPDSSAVDELDTYISDFGSFSTNADEDPYWFEFPGNPATFISEKIREDWLSAVHTEARRGSVSEYRRHHSPTFYNAVVDQDVRSSILEAAFPDTEPNIDGNPE